MAGRRSNKGGGYIGMMALTILVLAVATFLLVLIGRKLLEHENSQTSRIEALEAEKKTLNETIIDKDASIEDLVAHLAEAEKEIDALEDAYDLNAGKLAALEEWKADLEKKIENGELVSDNKDDDKTTEDDKKKEDKKDADTSKKDDKKEESDKKETESKSKGFYQKLVNGEDVNLLIIGDSIGEPMDDTSWVVLLQNWITNTYKVNCRVKNVSMSGNTSYAGYGRTMILPDADSYDLAVICYGHNDFDYGFGDMYELIIRAVQQKFPSCAIISILESSQRDYTEKIKTIQKICEYYNIPTADTIKAFSNSGIVYDELAPDAVHPEGMGRTIYFETIRDIIKPKVENNETYTYAERSPMYSICEYYDKVTYIKAEDFTRVDDVTFQYKGKVSGYIGIYYVKTAPVCGYVLYVDDVKQVDYTAELSAGFEVPIFHRPVAERTAAKESITLVFGSKSGADAFQGLLVSK